MASAPTPDGTGDVIDEFLAARGHDLPEAWDRNSRKKQCPDCQSLHDQSASRCTVCGWSPTR